MIGTKKLNEDNAGTPVVEADAPRYLVPDTARKSKREGTGLRIMGNLLITLGLVMLLGIGGWYGYTQWSNAQYVELAEQKWGADVFEPSLAATPAPTLPPLPTPLPVLTGGSSATQIGNIDKQAEKPVDTSPPVRLHIPSVSIDQQVVPVGWSMIPAPGGGVKSEWNVADYAVGHHKGTANPGQVGNVVLSGHVDYKGQVFKELHRVSKGDEVILFTEKGQYIYVVSDLVIVKEEGVSDEQKRDNAKYMNPTEDLTLTMITCWPYGIDTHRLIVIAKPYQSATSTQSEFTLR